VARLHSIVVRPHMGGRSDKPVCGALRGQSFSDENGHVRLKGLAPGNSFSPIDDPAIAVRELNRSPVSYHRRAKAPMQTLAY
jgi:hypothetical protein